MSVKLKVYLETHPEIVFEWSDPETEAKGWLVINSLKGGAAGGGTRMRKGLTRSEVEDLAKTMEIKFSVCGPFIGGAKSGIDFDPFDRRKKEVLQRWFKAISPLLRTYYGTAGDLNIDEKTEVSPFLHQLEIIHPQEGVLEGHFKYSPEIKSKTLKRLKTGCELPVQSDSYSPDPNSKRYTTIDLITGYGVSESVKIFYQLFKKDTVQNKRVFIQGWGNVGAATGWYLSKAGAKIIVIQDKEGYVVNKNGFSFSEITDYMNGKTQNTLHDPFKIQGHFPVELLSELNIEIFIPAAASKLVQAEFIEKGIANGLELISCGANVPFAEERNIFGSLTQNIDARISLIPDFIANCGVARLFSYLMENQGLVTEEAIFKDISETINQAIQGIYKNASEPLNVTKRALENFINN